MNNNLITYSLIFLIIIPIFGFNFLISFIGNLLLLVILIPILILLITLISLNSIKSNVTTCPECGNISFGVNETCVNCGADLGDINIKNYVNSKKPGETTIEVKAEEVK